jgi:hypothetical protein
MARLSAYAAVRVQTGEIMVGIFQGDASIDTQKASSSTSVLPTTLPEVVVSTSAA